MSYWKSINITYIYDGSFDGLLSLVFDCYTKKIIPARIVTGDYASNFLDEEVTIATIPQKANRVYSGIVNQISYATLLYSYRTFLSNNENKELDILQFLIIGFQHGSKIDHMLSSPLVLKIQKTAKRVFGEYHRLCGLFRFAQIGENLYYSRIHPDNNVVEMLGHHFMQRFPTQNLILHDNVRNTAFLYNTNTYTLVNATGLNIADVTQEEKQYQALWKTFYQTIGIKERKNSKLQMQYMPKKYWKDLLEKQL